MPYTQLLLLFLLMNITLLHAEFTVILPDASSAPVLDPPSQPGGASNWAHTDPSEQMAVQAIMTATGNDWVTSIADVCRSRWHGIECVPSLDGDVYHVVSLSFGALSDDTAFPACSIGATLSPAILSLSHLRSLFFYRCFTNNPQPIPSFLGQLGPTLRSLVLRENGHVGSIPAELGNLTALHVLDLHGNRLMSTIPKSFQRLRNLQLFDLSHNSLSGLIPELKLPKLKILDLGYNEVHGQIPEGFGQCVSLLKMDLSRNHLTGSIPDSIGKLGNLILLDLSHNSLMGPLPVTLRKLYALKALILNSNSMQELTISNEIFIGLKKLIILVLSDMGLVGPIPDSIGYLPSLRVLHLDKNKFNGSIPTSFENLKNISELSLSSNRLTGPVPFGKEVVWKLGIKLRLDNNLGLCFDDRNLKWYEGIGSMSGIGKCKRENLEGQVRTANAKHQTKHLGLRFNLNTSGAGPKGLVNYKVLLLLVFVLAL
jgi:Leucine rich repeat